MVIMILQILPFWMGEIIKLPLLVEIHFKVYVLLWNVPLQRGEERAKNCTTEICYLLSSSAWQQGYKEKLPCSFLASITLSQFDKTAWWTFRLSNFLTYRQEDNEHCSFPISVSVIRANCLSTKQVSFPLTHTRTKQLAGSFKKEDSCLLMLKIIKSPDSKTALII